MTRKPKYGETLFYLIPKEILIEIFEYLPLFEQQDYVIQNLDYFQRIDEERFEGYNTSSDEDE